MAAAKRVVCCYVSTGGREWPAEHAAEHAEDAGCSDPVHRLVCSLSGGHSLPPSGCAHQPSRFALSQIIKTADVAHKDCRRLQTTMYLDCKERGMKIKFPLPHRVQRAQSKQFRTIYKHKRPTTMQ